MNAKEHLTSPTPTADTRSTPLAHPQPIRPTSAWLAPLWPFLKLEVFLLRIHVNKSIISSTFFPPLWSPSASAIEFIVIEKRFSGSIKSVTKRRWRKEPEEAEAIDPKKKTKKKKTRPQGQGRRYFCHFCVPPDA